MRRRTRLKRAWSASRRAAIRLRQVDPRDVSGGHSAAREGPKKQDPVCPQKSPRPLKRFRYLSIPSGDIENPYLVTERTNCGKPACCCSRGMKHGPYSFLRYKAWDPELDEWRLRREYIPKCEVRRVRRWLRRRRAEELFWGGILRVMRRSSG